MDNSWLGYVHSHSSINYTILYDIIQIYYILIIILLLYYIIKCIITVIIRNKIWIIQLLCNLLSTFVFLVS